MTVETKTESTVAGLGGRPDIGVAVSGLLTGHVELKAPGTGARPGKFKGENRKQWEKFQALPNLVYTDGNEWALYRSAELIGSVIRFPGDVTSDGPKAIDAMTTESFIELMRKFYNWQPIAPSSPRGLAELLAPLCRLLRTDVLAAVQVKRLAGEWRMFLFPDADNFQFADAYAQTLTYAMLLARFEGVTDLRFKASDALDVGHGLLAQVLRVLAQPRARQQIEVPVELLERTISAVNPAAMGKSNDPWLYFYEDFLAAYDERMRKNRGVYYTPAPVVTCQVRLVTELLTSKLNQPLGMAGDGVTVLDPAAGTGTYLLAALQHSLDLVQRLYGRGAVAPRATIAAKNLHGFELLVGPYAVAHLRLSEQILAAGGQLTPDGARVYLTDTLESPGNQSRQYTLDLLHERLAEESKRARQIKAYKHVMVCIGNPPYYRQSLDPVADVGVIRQGGWVRYGDDDGDPILNDFLAPVTAAAMGGHAKNLYNLYVYFWRWALWKVFDSSQGPGIISFITASSYLRGPGFIGMREVLRRTLDELWIIDLEGDNLGARKTENVFAIQNPVAIAIGVRYAAPNPDAPAVVHYTRVTGSREQKFEWLRGTHSFSGTAWQECYSGWQEPLLPTSVGNFHRWPAVTDLFPWQHSGVQFKRTWPIGPTPTVLAARWRHFVTAPTGRKRTLFKETAARQIDGEYDPIPGMDGVDASNPMPPLRTEGRAGQPIIVRYGYRTLDRQWVLADSRLADRARGPLWGAHSCHQIYMTSLLTGLLGLGPAAAVTADVPDLHHFRGSFGGANAIPLWRDANATQANVTAGLLDMLSERLGKPIDPEDLFAYTYAILSAPVYVELFSEELIIPGPRLPITTKADRFEHAVGLGQQLVQLHTYGQRMLTEGQKAGSLPAGSSKCTIAVPEKETDYPRSYSYDSTTESLLVGDGQFYPVSQEVFEFALSDFKVLQSWLSYRMAEGAGRRSSDLDKIRPSTWTADMTEELLRLLWILEGTVALQPALNSCLKSILNDPVIGAEELPSPSTRERMAPRVNPAIRQDEIEFD